MPRVILLGTGSAWSGPERENTYLVVEGEESRVLVDCAGSPAQRLARAGVPLTGIDHVILTHAHPDHIYGWIIFVLNVWMAGRRAPLHLYGLPETLRSARTMLHAVGAREWPNVFPIRYHSVQPKGISLILAGHEFSVSATCTEHFVPTLGLRFTHEPSGASIAYSCDTSPNGRTIELARDVRYLFHEATTLDEPSPGHSSAMQAGAQARRAHAQELVLVHLPPETRERAWRAAARQEFRGPVRVAQDLDEFVF